MRQPTSKRDLYGGIEKALLQRFTKVPNTVLFRQDLSPGAKLTWIALKAHQWNEQSPFPSQQRLAAALAKTRQRVSADLKELKTKGLVQVQRQGSRRTAQYELYEPEV